MANEIRVRANFLSGVVDDNPLIVGATTLTSSSLSSFPVIDSTNHALVVLDPNGTAGTPEIVMVTAHGVGATTATISRGQESTTARQHNQNIAWVHSAVASDFVRNYSVTASNAVVISTTPVVDTVVDSMTINLPASLAPRTFLVSAFCKFGAGHHNGFALYLDTTSLTPGSRIGSTNAEASIYHVSISSVVCTVPGDNTSHTITLQYNAISSTSATTLNWRTINALLVG